MISQSTNRIHYLDSMRGIAAIMVVFYHFISWNYADDIKFKLSAFVFNGSDAVSFFFVLSGLVLSLGLKRNIDSLNIWKYTYKRIFRLYPAYVVTVLLNYLYANRSNLNLGIIKDVFWNNSQNLWQELTMLRANHNFYVPGWTLENEMALSLLMPFIVLAAVRNINWVYFIALLGFIMPSQISIFIFHFAIGSIIGIHFDAIRNFDFKKSRWYSYRYLILIITILLFSVRHIERISAFGPFYYKVMEYLRIDIFHYTGLASAVILMFVINNVKAQNLLNNKVFRFLGDISYSVYLCHWMIVVFIMNNWQLFLSYFPNFYLGFFSLMFICLLVTLLLSYFMYKYIELPFIRFAKK